MNQPETETGPSIPKRSRSSFGYLLCNIFSVLLVVMILTVAAVPAVYATGNQYTGESTNISNTVSSEYFSAGLYRQLEDSYEPIDSNSLMTVPFYVSQSGDDYIISGTNRLTQSNVFLMVTRGCEALGNFTITVGSPSVSITDDGNPIPYSSISISLNHTDENETVDYSNTWSSSSSSWGTAPATITSGIAYSISVSLNVDAEHPYHTESTTLDGSIEIPISYTYQGVGMSGSFTETQVCSLNVQSVIETIVSLNDDIITTDVPLEDLDDPGNEDVFLISGTETTYTDGETVLESVNIAGNSQGGVAKDGVVDIELTIPDNRQFCVGLIAGGGNGSFSVTVTYVYQTQEHPEYENVSYTTSTRVKVVGHTSYYLGIYFDGNGNYNIQMYQNFSSLNTYDTWFPYIPDGKSIPPESIVIHIENYDSHKINPNIGLDLIFREIPAEP